MGVCVCGFCNVLVCVWGGDVLVISVLFFCIVSLMHIYSFYAFVEFCNLCILIVTYVLFCIFRCHRANWHSSATLTEVFPCFFLRCKGNARV